MTQEQILSAVFFVFISYTLLMMFYLLFLIVIGFLQSRKRIFESREEDYSILLHSTFTIPVTIIVPAHNEEDYIENCIRSLLNLNYPEFEIIVVNDASTDRTFEILNEVLKLKSLEKSYESNFRDGKIHEIYTSEQYPHITVINKSGLRKAGALNAGLNFARYKYVCNIDADTILEPDSLLKIMAHVQKNPEKIIGVGSYFGLLNGLKIKDGKIIERSFSYNPIVAYQNLEYLRSFIGSRLSWSRFNAMPVISGGFGVWRRDILYELGGYDPNFTCEDIELTFRAHDYTIRNKKDYMIVSLPDYVGWTEGPSTIMSLIIQRSRWQRVTDETIACYKHMLFNPRYKWLAFLTLPYFLSYEILGVMFELTSIGIIIWAYFAGILNITTFFAFVGLAVLTQALISVLVIFAFLRDQKLFRIRYSIYLLSLSFFELFLYRWIITIAKAKGTLDYLRGVKTFDQYKRYLKKKPRPPAAATPLV